MHRSRRDGDRDQYIFIMHFLDQFGIEQVYIFIEVREY